MDKKDNTHKIVVAALIERNGKYLIAKRKVDAALGGLWEFPGGKVEDGETEQEALEREIVEEFNTLIAVGKLLASTQINDKTILKLYACEHKLGAYQLREHSELAWVDNLQQLYGYELAPADVELLEQITKDKRQPALHELVIGDAYKNEDPYKGMIKNNIVSPIIERQEYKKKFENVLLSTQKLSYKQFYPKALRSFLPAWPDFLWSDGFGFRPAPQR